MASSLGIYIDKNIVKYAKVNKVKNKYKIETYGSKYGNNTNALIEQIIEETNSRAVPIYTNAIDAHYEETSVFAMISNKDVKTAVGVEYERIMEKQKLNKELFEFGFLLGDKTADKEKRNILLAYQDKAEIETRSAQFPKSNLPVSQMPIELSIANVYGESQDCLIVNIEEDTYITTIKGKVPVSVKKVYYGMNTIIQSINNVENSLIRSYEVVRNSVLTVNENDNNYEKNDYLPVITNEILNICQEVRKELRKNVGKITKIYITGTGASINNIDIFMESIIELATCQLLSPTEIIEEVTIPIKEYIDVNSAIALAYEGLGYEKEYCNFRNGKASKNISIDLGSFFSGGIGLNEPLAVGEKFGIRLILTILGAGFIYGAFAMSTMNASLKASKNVDKELANQRSIISKIDKDREQVEHKKEEYETLIKKLNKSKSKDNETIAKNTIPNLMQSLSHIVPKGVTITDITESYKKVTIKSEATNYAEAGYFRGKIETDNILRDVKTINEKVEKDAKGNTVIKTEIQGMLVEELIEETEKTGSGTNEESDGNRR